MTNTTNDKYSAHDNDNTLLPCYFIANEWRKHWVERITQCMQDTVEAARLCIEVPDGDNPMMHVFSVLSSDITMRIDVLDRLCQSPKYYDVVHREASKLESDVGAHINMLQAMMLNLRHGDSEEPQWLSDAIEMSRCAMGGMAGACVTKRRWFQEHLKAMPF